MVQLLWHLWDVGKQDHDDVKLQALEQAMLFGRAVPGMQNPPEGLCVPRTLGMPGSCGENKRSEILSWSHLCMCVKKEKSDFLPEPPERAKQLTSKLTLTEVHY